MGITFAPGAEAHLLRTVGTDLAALRSELQKLHGLADEGPVTLERLGDMVGVRYGETPYDWRNAVMNGDTATALRLTPVVLSQTGVSSVRLAQLLGTALVATAATRAHYDRKVRGRALNTAVWTMVKTARPPVPASGARRSSSAAGRALDPALAPRRPQGHARRRPPSKSTTITGDTDGAGAGVEI
jgi:DNA polymerase III delta subunit